VKRLLRVARREYLERVRSKAFLVGTLLGPLLLFGVMLGPHLLLSKQRGRPLRIVVLDRAGGLGDPVTRALTQRQLAGQPRFELMRTGDLAGADPAGALRERVRRGELDGFVEMKAGADGDTSADYYGRNVSNIQDIQMLEHAIEEAVIDQRLTAAGLAADRVRTLTRAPAFKTIQVTAQGAREDRREAFLVTALLVTLLYSSLAMWGSAIMNGVLEEKTNRVVEVVVSSIAPSQLFGGKLLGVGAAGLTQFTIWGGTLVLIGTYGAALTGGAPLPMVDAGTFGAFLLFFLLGYFFYGALFAGLGATVNTQQEAQSLTFLVLLPLIGGFAFFPVVVANPDGPMAVGLSLIPFFAPMLMFLRISAVTPPAWQIALSIGLLLLGIAGAVVAGARVYRVGILMYGKRATFREIARWVGES
jgi:ABC-2 type transport system permease protein